MVHTCLVCYEEGECLQGAVGVVEAGHGFHPLEEQYVGHCHRPKPGGQAGQMDQIGHTTDTGFRGHVVLTINKKLLCGQNNTNVTSGTKDPKRCVGCKHNTNNKVLHSLTCRIT